MGEIAADIANEINQPLAAASNYLSAVYMLDQIPVADPKERADLLQRARSQITRTGEIIQRLREFTAGQEVEKRAEDLASLLEDAAQLVLVGSGRFDVELTYELDPSLLHVLANRVQVQQVIVNLLRNAIEAGRAIADHRICITVSTRLAAEDMVEVEFRDNGPGIPVHVMDQLYTRFTTTKPGSGMGIGLSISKRIIEAHGGALTACNPPGGGASFRFTLPLFTLSGGEAEMQIQRD